MNKSREELRLADPARIREDRDSLFEHLDREYLACENNQKHCYYWTDQITHFNGEWPRSTGDKNSLSVE